MYTNATKTWAFKRPYCSPSSGCVLAKTSDEAMKLIYYMYGVASNTEIYCAETEEQYKDT